MAFLYGRAGRLTAQNGGLRPGQVQAAEAANSRVREAEQQAGLDEGLLPLSLPCSRVYG